MSWKILRPMYDVVNGSRIKIVQRGVARFLFLNKSYDNRIKVKMKGKGAMHVVVGKTVAKWELGRHWHR